MSEYEGLNLPQLFERMHTTVEPEPVSWMPQTVGWIVLAVWLLVCSSLVAWSLFRSWQRNRYRREALAALDSIAPNGDGAAVAILLKRTALAAYPRRRVASLYGAAWAEFLCESSRHDPLVESSAAELASAAWRPGATAESLIAPARRWIKAHHA